MFHNVFNKYFLNNADCTVTNGQDVETGHEKADFRNWRIEAKYRDEWKGI